MSDPSTLEAVAERLSLSEHVVIMTGAGASRESGIPTFRDALEGYWSRFDPGELATPQAFERDAALVTRWYDERRLAALAASPHAGHEAITALQRRARSLGRRLTVITQNVDELHQRAGTEGVIELHGSLITWRGARSGERVRDLPARALTRYPPERVLARGPEPLRPDVVWFGEDLPEEALRLAAAASSSCELYLCVGTSGVVWPAAGLINVAAQAGAMTVEINPVKTPLSSQHDLAFRGQASQVLCALLHAVMERDEPSSASSS